MVFFEDVVVSKKTFLLIRDDKKQSKDKGTRFRVRKPLLGRLAGEPPKYVNPLHQGGWCRKLDFPKGAIVLQSAHHHSVADTSTLPCLGRRILVENLKWGKDVDFAGEAHYIRGYWEWAESIMSRCGDDLHRAGIFDAVYASLFTYNKSIEIMKAFCEAWCPATNTLLTSCGELSISLWDLHVLSGLPMVGKLYEEVVPSTKELIGSYGENKLYLPASCKYLFHDFHLIRSDNREGDPASSVSLEDWVAFWSRQTVVYQRPPPRKEKKSLKLRPTYNPTGGPTERREWNVAGRTTFSRLEVPEGQWHETHLAAFLSCWLCSFVLPTDDTELLRPSTFKMASIMASGRQVGLNVPVLASIYRGLNAISQLPQLSRFRVVFPVHFVYSWLAHYFKTHYVVERDWYVPQMIMYSGEESARVYDSMEARRRMHKWEQMSWNCTMLVKDRSITYTDGEQVDLDQKLLFMAIRSNYLAWRVEDKFLIEPYSPHRFSRQFGYYQVPPGILSRDIREADLKDGMQFWLTCLLEKSFARAIFPGPPSGIKKWSSPEYKRWWETVYGNFLEENLVALAHPVAHDAPGRHAGLCKGIGSNQGKRKDLTPLSDTASSSKEHNQKKVKSADPSIPSKAYAKGADDRDLVDVYASELMKEISGFDDEVSFQGSHAHLGSTSPNKPPPSVEPVVVRPLPQLGAVSEFNVKSLIDAELKLCLGKIWGRLRDRILKSSVEFLSSLEDEIRAGLLRMKSLSDLNLSSLETSIDMLFSRAAAFDQARSISREFGEGAAKRLAEVKTSLQNAEAKEKETTDRIVSTQGELAALEKKKEDFTASLQRDYASLGTLCSEIEEFTKEIKKLEDSPADGEVLENLKTSESLLKDAQKALEDQDPFA